MLRLREFWKLASIGLVLVALALLVGVTQAETEVGAVNGTTARVSLANIGTQANSSSYISSISADGRFTAFSSNASNLVENDTNGVRDVFVRDIQTGTTKRISVSSSGVQGDEYSSIPAISADGRFVAFVSLASTLVDNDTNGDLDIFLHDMQTGVTKLVSVSSHGVQGNSYSSFPAISADGRFVSFASRSSTLIESDTNRQWDVFVNDTQTGLTKRVSVASDGTQAAWHSIFSSISADGRFVTFRSASPNLIENDTNGVSDVFVHDTQTGLTKRVSVASDGTQANENYDFTIASNLEIEGSDPVISANGRFIAFSTFSSNLVENDTNGNADVFVHDMQTGVTKLVSVNSDGVQGNSYSSYPAIADDGRYVAFISDASNLVDGDTSRSMDVFLHDTISGVTELISIAGDGSFGNSSSGTSFYQDHTRMGISPDGRFVTFESRANNLVNNDTNGYDIFLRDRAGIISEPTPTPTPTPPSSAEQVVLFIPGIAGSQLVRGVSTLPGSYVWPAYFELNQNDMSLKPGSRRDDIYTDDVIRKYDPVNLSRFRQQIYGPFLDRLTASSYKEYVTNGDTSKRRQNGCDVSQTAANLFVYPWDWRFGAVDAVDKDGNTDLALSLAPNNTQLLKEYIQCILRIHPDADITLVSHSMGWFIGRTYVLENPTNHHITRHIAIAPPRLGAPDTIAMMLTGNWLPKLISKDLTRTLLEHFPGAHQLLPSSMYWEVSGSSPFAINGIAQGGGINFIDKDVEFAEFQQVLQSHYGSPKEGSSYRSTVPFVENMQQVYKNPAFADLTEDSSGIEYHIIYGVQDTSETTGKVVEKFIWQYTDEEVMSEWNAYDIVPTSGDGTVPVASASAMGNGYNLNGNAVPHKLIGSGMKHQEMMNEPRLQDCVLALLHGETCISDVFSATANQSTPARYIKLWGVDEIYVTDGISTTQNLITTTLTLGMFPEVSAKYLGDHSIMFIVKGDKQYTVNFTGQGEYFESESQYGSGDNNLRVLRFLPEPVAGQHLALVTTQNALVEMQVDTNGDEIADTKVEPLADLQGDVANDTTPPVVTSAYDPTTGLVVTATDTESGVESISYTVDGTHFQPYTVPVIFTDQSITGVTVIAQDKAGNFSKPATVPVTVIASNTIYLPLINR